MNTVRLPSGDSMPRLGQGTWFMGEGHSDPQQEIKALQHGIDLGLNLIDTAEMYADGEAEVLVGQAIAGRRDQVFLVSKVYPWNAAYSDTLAACERSLARMKTDHIDLYLLHWRGNIPFDETIRAMQTLIRAGKIRHWGVSNLDTHEMQELWQEVDGPTCQTNQILYNLTRRGPEVDLLPWCRDQAVPVMAYSPIEQGRLPIEGVLTSLAREKGVTPWQIALAWVLHQPSVIAIPKAVRHEHLEQNRAALDIRLSTEDLARLDQAFPRPAQKVPLEMI